jgi:hypothetical protein
MEKKKGKLGSSDGNDLITIGKTGENENFHQKRVDKQKELMVSQIERKKRVRELMAKREGGFEEKLL